MTILSSLATIFGTAMALANLPQAYKIFKRKSAKDISIITCSILTIGAIIWVLYGIEIKSFPFILSNTIGTISILLVVLGWFIYGKELNKKREQHAQRF